jgi:hypothetical protein
MEEKDPIPSGEFRSVIFWVVVILILILSGYGIHLDQ